MNDVIDCLYQYMLEYRYNSIITRPEYQRCRAARDSEADRLEEMLTAEQRRQFRLYTEQSDKLTDLSLSYMFRETLGLLRGLLTI